MGSEHAPGVQPALLQVTEGTRALLLRAADSPTSFSGSPMGRTRASTCSTPSSGFAALTDVGLAADDQDADYEKAAERASSFKRADIWKMHAYRDAIPDARSVWILYPGGELRFFGVPGGGGLAGGRVVSSPEGLPEEFEGVGAIPVAPVVGGEGGPWPWNRGCEWRRAGGDIGADAEKWNRNVNYGFHLGDEELALPCFPVPCTTLRLLHWVRGR